MSKETQVKDTIIEVIAEKFPSEIKIFYQENLAEVIHEENAVKFDGVISSPLTWLTKRINDIDQKSSHIIVEREKLSIELITEERNHFKNVVSGSMKYDTTFKTFAINTETFRTNKDWAALFKKHKYAFESLLKANELIKSLLNFKAKVEKEYEEGKDNKGNITDNFKRTVLANSLPEEFELKLPIFKGQTAIIIPCVFEVNDNDLSLSLWSDFVQVEVNKARDETIDTILGDIREIAPEIVIFEK